MALLRNDTHDARCQGGAPVPAGLALHQNIVHVVLDDRIGFVRLAKEAGPVLDFIRGVGNLAPEDALEIVKAELPAMLLDRSVERDKGKRPANATALPWTCSASTRAPRGIPTASASRRRLTVTASGSSPTPDERLRLW